MAEPPRSAGAAGDGLRAALRCWLYPYVPLAAAVFLLGAVAGAVAMATTSPAALEVAAEQFGEPALFPERLTTWTIFSNNVVVAGILATGVVTFGLTTFVVLFVNGLVVGVVLYAASGPNLGRTVVLILPHGVLEFSAFFLVSAVAFRTTWRLVAYLRGADDRPLTRAEAREALALALVSLVAIGVAAWIEANLTLEIARAVFGEVPGRR